MTRRHILLLCVSYLLSLYLPLINAFATVINPCIHFSWIKREWGDEYVALAKKTILDVVSKFNVIYMQINNFE